MRLSRLATSERPPGPQGRVRRSPPTPCLAPSVAWCSLPWKEGSQESGLLGLLPILRQS
jgi:hypothetical protein